MTTPSKPLPRSAVLALALLPFLALAAVYLASAGRAGATSAGPPEPDQDETSTACHFGYVEDTPVSAAQQSKTPDPPTPFLRIVLIESDASRVTVEEDGEVWWSTVLTKRRAQTLTPVEMEALRAALAQSGASHWTEGDATGAFGRSRLAVLLASGETRSVALPPPGLEAQRLLALLRSLASGD